MELKQKEKRSQLQAQEAFNKNPHQYAKKFLYPKAAQGKPGFSKEVANEFSRQHYAEKKRNYQYNPLRGIPKPAALRKQLSENPPSLAELQEVILRKSIKLSPGTNAVPYVIHKKCSKVLSVMHVILIRI